MAEDTAPERVSALPDDSGARSRLQDLFEEAASILGCGAHRSTLEAVLDPGPKLVDVYRKDRIRVAQLHEYDPTPDTVS